MVKIGHEELQSYMLVNPVKSEKQMIEMVNFFIELAINHYLENDLGLPPDTNDTV